MIPFILIDFIFVSQILDVIKVTIISFLIIEGYDLKHYATLFYILIENESLVALLFVENDDIGNGELQSKLIV